MQVLETIDQFVDHVVETFGASLKPASARVSTYHSIAPVRCCSDPSRTLLPSRDGILCLRPRASSGSSLQWLRRITIDACPRTRMTLNTPSPSLSLCPRRRHLPLPVSTWYLAARRRVCQRMCHSNYSTTSTIWFGRKMMQVQACPNSDLRRSVRTAEQTISSRAFRGGTRERVSSRSWIAISVPGRFLAVYDEYGGAHLPCSTSGALDYVPPTFQSSVTGRPLQGSN